MPAPLDDEARIDAIVRAYLDEARRKRENEERARNGLPPKERENTRPCR